jgi:hypothetical protein
VPQWQGRCQVIQLSTRAVRGTAKKRAVPNRVRHAPAAVDNPPGENNCTGSEGGPVIRILCVITDKTTTVMEGSAFGLPAKREFI